MTETTENADKEHTSSLDSSYRILEKSPIQFSRMHPMEIPSIYNELNFNSKNRKQTIYIEDSRRVVQCNRKAWTILTMQYDTDGTGKAQSDAATMNRKEEEGNQRNNCFSFRISWARLRSRSPLTLFDFSDNNNNNNIRLVVGAGAGGLGLGWVRARAIS